jgi:hypothetical protein
VTEAWFWFIMAVVWTGGWYVKGRFDGAEVVRRHNRTLNESRRKQ